MFTIFYFVEIGVLCWLIHLLEIELTLRAVNFVKKNRFIYQITVEFFVSLPNPMNLHLLQTFFMGLLTSQFNFTWFCARSTIFVRFFLADGTTERVIGLFAPILQKLVPLHSSSSPFFYLIVLKLRELRSLLQNTYYFHCLWKINLFLGFLHFFSFRKKGKGEDIARKLFWVRYKSWKALFFYSTIEALPKTFYFTFNLFNHVQCNWQWI